MRNVIPKDAKMIPDTAKRVFKGIIFDVYHWQQEMFDGSFKTFEMLRRPDTVRVIAIKDEKIVVLQEEQPGRQPFFGIPGGRHDREDESELDAAKRELLEETGLTFSEWRLLDVVQPQPKMDYFVYSFLATGLESGLAAKKDSGERIEVRLLDLDEVKKIVNDPKARPMANEIFASVPSLEELINLPAYRP